MKILILNWRDTKNPKAGGAEIVTLEHAKAWIKHGHNVTWFTSRFENSLKEEYINGVKIVRRGNSFTVYLLAPFFYFFSKLKYDLVIDEIHGIPFFTPLYVRKPKIAFIHEVADEIWDYMYPFPISSLGKYIESLYFKLYKNIRFWIDAESTTADLERYGIKRENCTAIPCSISNRPVDAMPQKEDNPTFIFVSRLVKMKGIEEVLKSFKSIFTIKQNARLWVVGEGEENYIEELKSKFVDKGLRRAVTLFGRVSDEKKLELMRKAHILLHASVKEGWGLVIIEAASQATPAVVYNVPGLKDSVKNGKTGIVLSKNSPQEMAEKALSLLEDSRKYRYYQEECLRWAKSLTWKKLTTQSLKLLYDVSPN